jgi:3-oxoacyl-[acyl-carrier protein] reductase
MGEMTRKKGGKIVNISSIAALGTAFAGTTAYASTKAGVAILTKRFALELGKYGINVNCVAPGFIKTEMSRGGRSEKEFEELARSMRERTILARIGEPADIANAVLFFASEESSFVTGQVLVVDGGRMDFLTHSI